MERLILHASELQDGDILLACCLRSDMVSATEWNGLAIGSGGDRYTLAFIHSNWGGCWFELLRGGEVLPIANVVISEEDIPLLGYPKRIARAVGPVPVIVPDGACSCCGGRVPGAMMAIGAVHLCRS